MITEDSFNEIDELFKQFIADQTNEYDDWYTSDRESSQYVWKEFKKWLIKNQCKE